MKKTLYILMLIIFSVFVFSYDPPENTYAPLLHTELNYVPPSNTFAPLLHGAGFQLTLEGPHFINVCNDTTLFHNVNLTCQFNATSNYTNLTNPYVWNVNDSRVSLGVGNNTAYVVDDPSISDYNLPGCWDINVSVTDVDDTGSESHIFKYCINDTAPRFTENCTEVTLFHNINLQCQFNATDAENDPIIWSINDSRVNISQSGLMEAITSLSDYNMPGGWEINITINDSLLNASTIFTYKINDSAPYFTSTCDLVHLFHNENLTCQFNATDPEGDPIVWGINESRVDITQGGYIVDDPILHDYNMPDGWIINVSINDTLFSNWTYLVYMINDTAPNFTELFSNLIYYNSDVVNFAANFTDAENDPAELGLNCSIINATVFNSSSTYNISRQATNETESSQLCNLEISDTVLNLSQLILVNITVDPATVATYTISFGENMSGIYPDLTLYYNQTNFKLMLTNSSNNPQENMTTTNPYLILNNTDDQILDVTCRFNVSISDIFFNLSVNYSANKTAVSNISTLITTNISPNVTVGIYPWIDYVDYNFSNTSARNDDVNLTCKMVVP